MKEWFSGVVRGKTTNEKGKDTIVRHLYLVDAMGFTEAENVLVRERFPAYKFPKVISLKREVVEDILYAPNTDKAIWWKVVAGSIWLDVKGREKMTKYTYMISAETAGDVRDVMIKSLNGNTSDWKILKIEATKVLEVILHEDKSVKDELR